eukprot:TRINITY_DN11407_c0_g1_i13.p1 TRINITY_DN11407_c0_g1~~TRINITY_DN11407_c0_g1_i13.p1  ORF type:complete len:125 (+),score=37.67 TRINITY_DN11407_c0_g1_i13:133-507(+)
MLRSLVGSEMCIRDRWGYSTIGTLLSLIGSGQGGALTHPLVGKHVVRKAAVVIGGIIFIIAIIFVIDLNVVVGVHTDHTTCLLYTSDAADEEDSVDLGGRRIIKKKKKKRKINKKNTHKKINKV